MDINFLTAQIHEKQSYLCVGLDSDIQKIPKHLLDLEDPIYAFNKQIIDQTKDLCVAYKLNIAFYESMGAKGWVSLKKTLSYIPKNIFTIADAKRGDIGNTSAMYARTFFETYDFDSITISPYMGIDSVTPFLNIDNKWVILLALTSNKGSSDFQLIEDKENVKIYEHVLKKSQSWADHHKMMYVVGATHPNQLAEIRKTLPNHFFLIPGVGAQGGNLEAISKAGINDNIGMLVNSSRGIIYAGQEKDFALAARNEALKLQQAMSKFLSENM